MKPRSENLNLSHIPITKKKKKKVIYGLFFQRLKVFGSQKDSAQVTCSAEYSPAQHICHSLNILVYINIISN